MTFNGFCCWPKTIQVKSKGLAKISFEKSAWEGGYFPGGPVGKNRRSQCRGPGFDPWSGN